MRKLSTTQREAATNTHHNSTRSLRLGAGQHAATTGVLYLDAVTFIQKAAHAFVGPTLLQRALGNTACPIDYFAKLIQHTDYKYHSC